MNYVYLILFQTVSHCWAVIPHPFHRNCFKKGVSLHRKKKNKTQPILKIVFFNGFQYQFVTE